MIVVRYLAKVNSKLEHENQFTINFTVVLMYFSLVELHFQFMASYCLGF